MKIIINGKVYKNNVREDIVKLRALMEKGGFYDIPMSDLEDMWDNISDIFGASRLEVPETLEELATYLERIEL